MAPKDSPKRPDKKHKVSEAEEVGLIQNGKVSLESLSKLMSLLSASDLSEIDIEEQGTRIRLSRAPVSPALQQSALGAALHQTPPSLPKNISAPEQITPGEESLEKHPGMVPSPMIGTVYLSPEPGASPFSQVGADVEKGQTLLIIEAMKTMNQIAAPRAGKILKILVENAQPVEYGQPLVILE